MVYGLNVHLVVGLMTGNCYHLWIRQVLVLRQLISVINESLVFIIFHHVRGMVEDHFRTIAYLEKIEVGS